MARYALKLISALALTVCAMPAAAQETHVVTVGANYTYVRTNILPGCSCFSLNGGGLQLQIELTPRLALSADSTLTHREGITPDAYRLTQLTYMAGVRFWLRPLQSRILPFSEIKLGGASTFGTLSPSRTGVGGSDAFAFEPGGGFQVRMGPRMSVVPLQADYLLTTFGNGVDNHQNDLRISAGILIRLRH